MGILIYVKGSVQARPSLNEEQKKALAEIVDNWESPVFYRREGSIADEIEFRLDQIEGCDPLTDYVIKPLEELMTVADKNGFVLDGDFTISSDWGDYDNILISVTENKLDYGNSEIRNAATDELVKELANRKVLPKGFKSLDNYGLNIADGDFKPEAQLGADLVIAVPEMNAVIRIAEGTGDNLLKEDEAEGYVDYINYDIYTASEIGLTEVPADGGMVMSKEYIRDKYDSLLDAVSVVLEMAYNTSELTYFVISGGRSWKEAA